MNRELLIVRVHEELDLTPLSKEYVPLVDRGIKSRIRKGVTYTKDGQKRYVKMDDSLFPKIGENILRILPESVITNYRIHPNVINFRYTPYATSRGLDIKDEEDMLDYHFYVTTSQFRHEQLANLEAYRILGITGILFYCGLLFQNESCKIKLPYLPLLQDFKGGVTERGTNISLVAMIGNSWEKQERDILTSTAIAGTHEIGHTFELEHYSPHSGLCLMSTKNDEISNATEFCEQCVKVLTQFLISLNRIFHPIV